MAWQYVVGTASEVYSVHNCYWTSMLWSIQWYLSKQSIRWPALRYHIAGSDLELIDVTCSCKFAADQFKARLICWNRSSAFRLSSIYISCHIMSFFQGDPGSNGEVGKRGPQGSSVSMIDIPFLLTRSNTLFNKHIIRIQNTINWGMKRNAKFSKLVNC